MADKCSICYRNLGTWKKDPILLPNGAPYDWIDDTHLVYEPDVNNRWYRGVYQISEPEVQELQDALKTLETELLDEVDRTTFSPLNTSGKFQITGKHIKEMRDSVEKLIDILGLTKTNYFNYDDDFNHIIHPNGDKTEWTDPITSSTDLIKFQVKGIHIEDLRHKIQSLWKETWDTMPLQSIDKTISGTQESGNNSLTFDGDRNNIWGRTWSWATHGANAVVGANLDFHVLGNQSWVISIIGNNHYLENSECGRSVGSGAGILLTLQSGMIPAKIKVSSNKLYLNVNLTYTLGGSIVDGHLRVGTYLIQGTGIAAPSWGNWVAAYISKVYLQVFFSNGNSIVYYDIVTNMDAGNWSLPTQSSSCKWLNTNMNSFNRCLYDDYITVFGVEPDEDEKINNVTFFAGCNDSNFWELIGVGYGWRPSFLYHTQSSLSATLDTMKLLYAV